MSGASERNSCMKRSNMRRLEKGSGREPQAVGDEGSWPRSPARHGHPLLACSLCGLARRRK